jgi:hypothetical protein
MPSHPVPLAQKIVLQVALRDIGQLTDIERWPTAHRQVTELTLAGQARAARARPAPMRVDGPSGQQESNHDGAIGTATRADESRKMGS